MHRQSEKWLQIFLKKKYDLKEKENFVSTRKGIADLNAMSLEERNEYIRRNPAYGILFADVKW